MRSGTATSANSQKLGLRKAVTVNASHTVRRREKSLSELNLSATGLASWNVTVAIAKTTIRALKLAGMVGYLEKVTLRQKLAGLSRSAFPAARSCTTPLRGDSHCHSR